MKRSARQLLRLRNKELREARATIDRLTATPTYSLRAMAEAIKDCRAQKSKMGTHLAVSLHPPMKFGPIMNVQRDTLIYFIQDEAP